VSIPVPTTSAVVLWWIPVGAGGHVVRRTSRWWELADAAVASRPPRRLFHAALEVHVDGRRFAIEMAPAWGCPPGANRGVVRTGPVGLRVLGRWRLFRYEVRCWPNGTIPDLRWAEGGSTTLTTSAAVARALVERVRDVPDLVWGRTVDATGDMWNSNSLVSWLMSTTGLDPTGVRPPDGGRAPGWRAGSAIAAAATSATRTVAGSDSTR